MIIFEHFGIINNFQNNKLCRPTAIRWRPVAWGFLLQFLFGVCVLRWEWGASRFVSLSNTMIAFLDYTKNGTDFTFGFLSAPPPICGMEPVIAFQVNLFIYLL
jgi:nucleoside permease NupC